MSDLNHKIIYIPAGYWKTVRTRAGFWVGGIEVVFPGGSIQTFTIDTTLALDESKPLKLILELPLA